ESGDRWPVSICEGVTQGEECLSVTLLGSRKCRLEVLGSAHLESLKRHSQPLGRYLGLFPNGGMARLHGILEHANPRKPWHEFLQELQPLRHDLFTEKAQSRHVPTGTRQAAH